MTKLIKRFQKAGTIRGDGQNQATPNISRAATSSMEGRRGYGNLNELNQQLGFYQGTQTNGGPAAVHNIMYDDNGEPIVINPYLLDEVTVRPSQEDKRVLRKIRGVMPDYDSRMILYNAYGSMPQKLYKTDWGNVQERIFDSWDDADSYDDSLRNKYKNDDDYESAIQRREDGKYSVFEYPQYWSGGYENNDIALNDYVDRAADIIPMANRTFLNFTMKNHPGFEVKYIAKPLGIAHGTGDWRGYYLPATNTAYNINSVHHLEAELAHPIELKYNNRSSLSYKNLLPIDAQVDTYNDPDNIEMHTHSVVEPIISSYIRQTPLKNIRTGRRFIPRLENIPGLIRSQAAALKLKREPQIALDADYDINSDNSDIIR